MSFKHFLFIYRIKNIVQITQKLVYHRISGLFISHILGAGFFCVVLVFSIVSLFIFEIAAGGKKQNDHSDDINPVAH